MCAGMKLILPCLVCMIAVMAGGNAAAAEGARPAARVAPDIIEVQRAALKHNNLDGREVARWKKRARLAALLPRFQFDYGMRRKVDVNVDVSENVYVGSSGVTVGPDDGQYSHNANSDQNIGVKAIWYLNELIFNPDQLDISRESRSLIRERQMLLAEVNKHYYERKRLAGLIDALQRGTMPPGKKMTREREIYLAQVKREEETAALDALTGGWFSHRGGGDG